MREFKLNDIVEVNLSKDPKKPEWNKVIFRSLRTDFKSSLIYNCCNINEKTEFSVYEHQIRQIESEK